MTKEQDALKLSLEALEPFSTPHWAGTGVDKANAAITAIKEALAQPAQRPWVGLTEEEIVSINDQHYNIAFRDFDADVAIARAIEAKLKAVNGFHSTEKNT